MTKKLLILLIICTSFLLEAHASRWRQRASLGTHGRHRGTAITIGNKGYMGLGHYNGAGPNIVLNDWWQYDPATNSWAQKADYIGLSNQGGLGGYGVLSFGTDKFGFVGGGTVSIGAAFYKYDPTLNVWTPAATLPVYSANVKGFVIDNKAYFLNGANHYEYDVDTDTWSTKSPAPFGLSIWNSAFVVDNKGYILSGTNLWEYKPVIDAWTPRANFPGASTGGAISFAQERKGYIVCGYAGWLSQVNSEVWEFDPATNQWDSLPPFPGTSRRFASSFTIGERAFLGIGTNGTNFNDIWEFDADATAGENELKQDIDIKVGPNPAVEVIHFSSDDLQQFEIELYDQNGRKVRHHETINGKLSIFKNELPAGAYYYKILRDNEIIEQNKFIYN